MISLGYGENIFEIYNNSQKENISEEESGRIIEALNKVCDNSDLMEEVRKIGREYECKNKKI